jgi:hypothetical protein
MPDIRYCEPAKHHYIQLPEISNQIPAQPKLHGAAPRQPAETTRDAANR